ncbi:unnamed protein product [Rotaria sordida]|uniref:Uncharacterized protein n=1 Tax=Rotaria sordida TaxID=392033 RepID=A0A815ASI5_9BILA
MSLDKLHLKLGKALVLLHKDEPDNAYKELTVIINELVKTNTPLHNEEANDLLIVSCLERVNLSYEKKKFQEFLYDVQLLQKLNYDIYSNSDLALKKL